MQEVCDEMKWGDHRASMFGLAGSGGTCHERWIGFVGVGDAEVV